MMPHLGAAYNLARWLTRNHHDAEDVVQEAYLRAFEAFGGFRGGPDGRGWLLTIVRNACFTRLRRERPAECVDSFNEEIHSPDATSSSPEAILLEEADAQRLR